MIDHPIFGRVFIEDLEPNQLLSCFLHWSYLYYVRLFSPVDDSIYDRSAQILLDRWEEWQHHPHAHLVTEGDLRAGTLYAISNYPRIIIATSEDWIRQEWRDDYKEKGYLTGDEYARHQK